MSELPEFRGTDRFEILQLLGAGGMGVVYEAFDRDRAEKVALKVLSKVDPNHLYLFKQEFRSLADVLHPNLVGLHEMLSDGNEWFFTMDLVAGVDFLSYVRGAATYERGSGVLGETEASSSAGSSGGLPTSSDDETMAVTPSSSSVLESSRGEAGVVGAPAGPPLCALEPDAEQRLRTALHGLCIAVAGLHAAGKIHRDLKPSNVKVDSNGKVVLLDFGLVTDALLEAQGGGSGLVVGTLPYMSPEQASGGNLTPASDWYSVGVMLYEALAGRVPYSGSVSQVLMAKHAGTPEPPDALSPGVPRDLQGLCMSLLSPDPALRPKAHEILSALGVAPVVTMAGPVGGGSSELIGREGQLVSLSFALETCRRGRAVWADVVGRSGTGKSVLVERFLDGATEAGALVLAGRCYERESVPYKAVDPIVDALAGWLRTLPRADAERLLPVHSRTLASMFPVLDRVTVVRQLPEPQGRTWDKRELRFLAFDAMRDLLARIAKEKTLVIHIDDFHWGDQDSAKLLKELMRPPDPPRLMLVLSYRAEEASASEALEELLEGRESSQVACVRVDVGRLTGEEAFRLALAHLDPVSSDVRERAAAVAVESEGIPFFVEELCRHVAGAEAGGRRLEAGVSLDEYVRSRAALLSPGAQALLWTAAVAGSPVRIPVAVQASGLSSGTSHALNELRAAHMLRAHGAARDASIECFHDRVREAISAGLAPDEKVELHGRLGSALEASGKAGAEELCLHFHEGGQKEKAAGYARTAAQAAQAAFAFDRAASLFRMALEDGEWPATQRLELSVWLGDALANAGRGAAAASVYQEAADAKAPSEGWRLRVKAVEQLLKTGHIDEGTRCLETIGEQVGLKVPRSEAGTMLRFLFLRARLRMRGLRYAISNESAVRESLLTRTDVCWSVASGLGFFLPMLGMLFQARGFLAALDSGEPYRLLRALCLEAGYDAAFGGKGIARSLKLHEMAEPLIGVAGNPQARAIFLLTQSIARFQMGRWRECRDLAVEAEKICLNDLPGASWELHTSRLYKLAGSVYMGRLKAYHEEADLLLQDARDRGDIHSSAHLSLGSPAHKELLRDRPDLVKGDVESAFSALPENKLSMHWVYGMRALIHARLYQGDAAGAFCLATEMAKKLRFSTLTSVLMVRTLVAELQAMSALASFESLPARKVRSVVGSSMRELGRQGIPHAAALAGLLGARLAAIEGRSDEAVQSYGAAAQRFRDLDMPMWMHAALWRRHELSSDRAHEQDRTAALDYFRGEGAVAPEKLVGAVAPG